MTLDEKAEKLIRYVGGKENISNMTHCATRLRFNLKDKSIVDTNAVEETEGVISVVEKAGQYQIVMGLNVDKVYASAEKLLSLNKSNLEKHSENKEKTGLISSIFSSISSIFAPLLPALAGSGVLRGLTLLAVQVGILNKGSGTYSILTIASMSVFYFLPVLLAFTAAKKFDVSPYISVLIGAALIHPDLIALMGAEGNGATSTFAGIPVVLMNYSSTVIPIILAIWIYSYLEKFLRKHIIESLQLVFIPLLALIIMVPLTIIAIGPLGVYGGEFIARIINSLIETNGLIAGAVVGGGWSVLVSFGLHWAVNPIMINNISTLGYDYINPLTFACNFAVAGTAIGVFLKTKNKKLKSFALTGAITIGLSGIIEPALYGILVKYKKIFLAQIIGGAIGGAFMGFFKVSSNAFVFGGLTTTPAFVGGHFLWAVIGLAISFIISAILAYVILGEEESK